MAQYLIRQLYTEMPEADIAGVRVDGWVRTMRESKAFAFVELNDGSYFRNLQVVLEADKLDNYRELTKQITLGAAVAFEGTLVLTPDMKQPFELKAASAKSSAQPGGLSAAKKRQRWNTCAPFSTCARAQTCSSALSACVPSSRRRFIATSTTRASSTFIRR